MASPSSPTAYTVDFLPTALEELASLPKGTQIQILKRIEGLKGDPYPAGIKRLKSTEKFIRLRVGNYRVIYEVDGKRLLVLVIKIGDRKDIYETSLEVLARRAVQHMITKK